MSLISVPTLKGFLNIRADNTSQDPWLTALAEAASVSVKTYCRQNFEEANYTQYYTGSGFKQLVLRERPLLQVYQVYLDHYGNFDLTPGAFANTTLLTPGIDYSIDFDTGSNVSSSGILWRINTVWAEQYRISSINRLTGESGPNPGNIKVVYRAGYTPIPLDIQYAVCHLVSYMRRTIKVGGELISERIGDYSYKLLEPMRGELPVPEIMTARSLLSHYREVAF